MATKKTTTVKPIETKTEVKPVKVESKKIKLIFKRDVIADCGTFKKGDIAELNEKDAEILLKVKGVEKC